MTTYHYTSTHENSANYYKTNRFLDFLKTRGRIALDEGTYSRLIALAVLPVFALLYSISGTGEGLIKKMEVFMGGEISESIGQGLALFVLSSLLIAVVLSLLAYEIKKSMTKTRNQGSNGEVKVNEKVFTLNEQMNYLSGGQAWSPISDGIKDIVFMTNNGHSQEFDNLIVAGNTIFVIEVKNWHGYITEKSGVLYRDNEVVKSPKAQTKNKLKTIDGIVNTSMDENGHLQKENTYNIVPIYVFSNDNVKLDVNLPHEFVTLKGLSDYFRYYRDNLESLNAEAATHCVNLAKKLISEQVDLNPNAKHKHLMRLASYEDASPSLKAYKKKSLVMDKLGLSLHQVDGGRLNQLQHMAQASWVWLSSKYNALLLLATLLYSAIG